MLSRISWITAALFLGILSSGWSQPIVEAHYLTFDNETPGALAQGTTLIPASTERADYFVERVVAYSPSGSNDGPEIAAPSLANPLQGGQVLACDPANSNDEGLWVEMTQGFPVGDITVEAMFFTSEVNPDRPSAEFNLGLQTIVGTEVPGGAYVQGQLRILGSNGELQWNVGIPGGGEVRVTAPVLADTWYHAAGIVHYNESDPANSSIELFLAAGAPINLGTDSQGTAAIDLSSASVLVGWAAELDVVNGPDAIPGDPDNDPSDNKNRYFIGCGSNNAINGDDYRGLLGEIDAVAVTAQDTEIYLPDAPPAPAVLGTAAWGSYR